jgi:DNA-binding transcriptional MerR regulator
MQIGKIAERSGLSTKALRYYERVGLIEEPTRTPSGYRDYSEPVLDRLRFIRSAQAAGLALGGIKGVIAFREQGSPPCGHVLELIEGRAADLDRRIAERCGACATTCGAWPNGAVHCHRRPVPPTWSATSSTRRRRSRSLEGAASLQVARHARGASAGHGRKRCGRQAASDSHRVGYREPERAGAWSDPGVGRGRRREEVHEMAERLAEVGVEGAVGYEE